MRSVIVMLVVLASPSIGYAQQGSVECRPAGPLVRMDGLAEASGLAVSRRVPGRLWSHNDSGEPVLFALDAQGKAAGELRLTGADVEDWEAIGVGPCAAGSCLYVADIGDNDGKRKRVTVYRLPEPTDANGSAAVADVVHATYPDGGQDAETLLIAGDGRLHIVTKGDTGSIAIYRFPAQLESGGTHELERIGEPAGAKPGPEARITDGAVSPDGQWVVLRTRTSLTFYRATDLFAGRWREARRVDLRPLGEPQGEGIALGAGNTVYLASEGGGKKQPGTFARFTCAPNGG